MDRTYSSSKIIVRFAAVVLPLSLAILIGLIAYTLSREITPGGPPASPLALALVSAVLLGILVAVWYAALRVASQIRVKDDSVVEFRAPLLRISLSPSDITSIRATAWRTNSVIVTHTRGKVLLYTPIDGFYEFLGWLKAKNPNVEIRWL